MKITTINGSDPDARQQFRMPMEQGPNGITDWDMYHGRDNITTHIILYYLYSITV